MGQRANYIILDKDKKTIHYNHWRANSIATDLYLGEKLFLDFVNECQLNEELMNDVWIEGCVIIDLNTKSLFFWSLELTNDTSVIEYYLKELTKKWGDWKINILKNRMYDVEKILAIDYISNQTIETVYKPTKEEVVADIFEGWVATLVVIKKGTSIFVTKTGNLYIENIISFGQEIITLLKNKPSYDLPKEGKDSYSCILIDEDNRKIFINESILGLIELSKENWLNYNLIIGDFGYIEILRFAGIETKDLEFSEDEIISQFSNIVQINDNFDPFELAEKIKQEQGNVEFNPNFFDNIKPKM